MKYKTRSQTKKEQAVICGEQGPLEVGGPLESPSSEDKHGSDSSTRDLQETNSNDLWTSGLELMETSEMIIEMEVEQGSALDCLISDESNLDLSDEENSNNNFTDQANFPAQSAHQLPEFKILQWNVDGIAQRRTELAKIIDEKSPHVIMIQETHLKTETPTPNFLNYDTIRLDRPITGRGTRKCGGIITYIKRDPAFNHYTSDSFQGEINTKAEMISTVIDSAVGRIALTNIYRNAPSVGVKNWTRDHKKWLENQAEIKFSVLAGDLNFASESTGYDRVSPDGKDFDDWLAKTDYELIEFKNKTFYSASSKTWTKPDVCLLNQIHEDIFIGSEDIVCDFLGRGTSDHRPILTTINLLQQEQATTDLLPHIRAPNYNFKKTDTKKFLQSIDDASHAFIEQHKDPTITETNSWLCKTLKRATKKSTPRGCYRKRIQKDMSVQAILDEIDEIDCKVEANEGELDEDDGVRLIELQGLLREENKKKKANEIELAIENDCWKVMSRMGKANNESKQSSPNLTKQTEKFRGIMTAKNPIKIQAQREALLTKLNEAMNTGTELGDSDRNICGPITIEETTEAAKNVKLKKAPGYDQILNEMIRMSSESTIFQQTITKFFNQILKTGSPPRAWKKALLVLIPKPDSNDFRPISLISGLQKWFEGILANRITYLFERFEQERFQCQFGFRPQKSCSQVSIYLKELAATVKEKNEYLAITTVDFKKCYDSVNINLAIDKIMTILGRQNAAIAKVVLNLFTGRRIACIGNQKRSKFLGCSLGLGQGSRLSTLMWIGFCSDLIGFEGDTDYAPPGVLFADDSNLLSIASNPEDLVKKQEKAYENVQNWCTKNEMTLHPGKTKTTIITNKTFPPSLKEKFKGEVVPDIVILGVSLNKNELFKFLKIKLEKTTKALGRLKSAGTTPKHRRMYYRGVAESIIRYYGPTLVCEITKQQEQKLNTAAKRAICNITGAYKSSSVDPVFESAHLNKPVKLMQMALVTALDTLKDTIIWKKLKLAVPKFKRLSLKSLKPPSKTYNEITAQAKISKDKRLAAKVLAKPKSWWKYQPPLNSGQLDSCSRSKGQAKEAEAFIMEIKSDKKELYFTDGSCKNEDAGGGLVREYYCDSEGKYVQAGERVATTGMTAQAAEMTALHKAVQAASTHQTDQHIFTDSYSSISLLRSRTLRNETAANTFRLLQTHPNIKIHHIPSHTNIEGNEKADQLAAEEVKRISKLKKKERTIDYQNQKIAYAQQLLPQKLGNLFFEKFQKDNDAIRVLSRYYTKANALNGYLFRINLSENMNCDVCTRKWETLDHFMNECPQYSMLRGELVIMPNSWEARANYILATNRKF